MTSFPKPTPRVVERKIRQKLDAADERAWRAACRLRDKGRCRVPNCRELGHHLHHIVYRSKSKRMRWLTSNCVWLCVEHHQLEHAGIIHITGNADEEIVITGDVDRLRFRI